VALAAWVLPRRDVRLDGRPFVLPGGPLIPLATVAAIAAVIGTGRLRAAPATERAHAVRGARDHQRNPHGKPG
jgi:APA family basic amino acid/polyamine antiporter